MCHYNCWKSLVFKLDFVQFMAQTLSFFNVPVALNVPLKHENWKTSLSVHY